MKKAFLALSIALLAVSSSYAQQTIETPTAPAQTTFFAELGGPGVLFSANIDRRFAKSQLGWGGRAGVGFVTTDEYSPNPSNPNYYRQRSVVTFPVQVNYIFGKDNSPHTFEVGAGATVLGRHVDVFNFDSPNRTHIMGTAAFMYRRQPRDGGFAWRIGFTPFFYSGYIQSSGGVSVGYVF